MSVFFKKMELLLSDNEYKINLYVNNSLYKTLKVAQGESSGVLGSATGNDNTYEFYGWSTSPTSTTRRYTNTASISPTSNMNLYAIFKHYVFSVGATITNYKYVADENIGDRTYYFKANSDCNLKIYGLQSGTSISGPIRNQNGYTGVNHLYINGQDKIYSPDSTITENEYYKYVYYLSAGDVIKIDALGGSSGSNYRYSFKIFGEVQFSYASITGAPSGLSELTLNSIEYVLNW